MPGERLKPSGYSDSVPRIIYFGILGCDHINICIIVNYFFDFFNIWCNFIQEPFARV